MLKNVQVSENRFEVNGYHVVSTAYRKDFLKLFEMEIYRVKIDKDFSV